MADLIEKVGVASRPFQEQKILVDPVDQEPVWLDVAFPVIVPVAGKVMVSVFRWKGFAGLQ